mgnify:CR=1 FL=1
MEFVPRLFSTVIEEKKKGNVVLYFETRLQTIQRNSYIEPFYFGLASFAPTNLPPYSSPPIEISK